MGSGNLSGFFVLFSVILLGLIFISSNASAQNTCSDSSQIILKLSSSTNAHGELWNGSGGYNEEVCYNQIFGISGSGNRACTGGNKVLGLSSSINAHAEIPNETSYNTNVCYSGLSCTARSGSCQAGESLIVSLSDTTNAHLSATAGYGQNICCTLGGGGQCQLTNAYWSFNGIDPIIDSDSNGKGDTAAFRGQNVKLIVEGTGCGGQNVSFEVWEDDLTGDDPVTTNPVSVTFSGTKAVGTWAAEYQNDGIGGGDPEYYFEASVSGSGTVNSQNKGNPLLTVIDQSAPCSSISICGDYSGQNSCDVDLCAVIDNSVPPGVDCNNPNIDCSCSWDSSGGGSCNAVWNGTTGYPPFCGDGIINPGEQCDGGDWGAISSCSSFGLSGSGLACNPTTCKFDTSNCTGTSGICGDGNINPGETCDLTDWGTISGCGSFDAFSGGALSCNSCQFNTTQCTGGPGNENIGRCIYTQQSTDNCDDGFLTFSWTSNWVWDESNPGHNDPNGLYLQCKPGQKTVECPAQIPLPFFGFYNAIAVILAVTLIYFILQKRKEADRFIK